MSGLSQALVRIDQARVVVDELGDELLMARLEYQRANILGRAGELAAAFEGIEGAVRHLDGFTPREQCSVHITRGMLAVNLSRAQVAITSFAEAARVAREFGYARQEFMALHNQGYATYLLGDLPRALAVMDAADELEADVFLAPSRLDHGRVLLEAGLLSEAVEVLRRGASEVGGEGHGQLRAEFDLELARALRLMGQLDESASCAEAAQVEYAHIGAAAWEAKATLTGLLVDLDRRRRATRLDDQRAGGVQLSDELVKPARGEGSRHSEANADTSEVLAAAAVADALRVRAADLGDHDLEDQARVVAGEALLVAGDVDAARARLLDPRRSAPGSLADELSAAAATAELYVASGELATARRLLRSAVKRLAAGQQGSASLDLRTARAVHGVRLAAVDLDLAVPRGSVAVLETLERWRSATDRLPSLGRPSDERLAALTESLRSAHAQRRTAGDAKALRELQWKATRLEQQVRARDWALSSGADAAAAVPMRVHEGREALSRADRDLIWLFPHGGRLCGVGVIGGRASLRDLMALSEATELSQRVRVDLRAAATHQLGPLATAVWRSLETSVARLDDAAIRPWRAHRSGLVLVTSPEVSAVPWALLPSLVGRPLTVARSLTSFARRVSGRAARPDGNPTQVHVSVGPGLARAATEAGAVARAWAAVGAEVKLAQPSVGAHLIEALASGVVVHVAAHGTHQVQSPLFSSLSLHDGPVFAHELQPTGVGAEHVVLSACDVGSASFRPGDEQLGMAASMISLGARSVVAAVAPIPDDVAAAAMTAHHEALAGGAASDEALALAIASTDPVAAAFLNLGGRFVP